MKVKPEHLALILNRWPNILDLPICDSYYGGGKYASLCQYVMKNISSSNLFLSLLDVFCDSGYHINHRCEAYYVPCEFNCIKDVEFQMNALRYLIRNGLMCLISTDNDRSRRTLINRIGISFRCQPAADYFWSKYADLLLIIK